MKVLVVVLLLRVLRFLVAAWPGLRLVLLLHDHHILTLRVLAGFLKQLLALFKFETHRRRLDELLRLFAAIALLGVVSLVHLLHGIVVSTCRGVSVYSQRWLLLYLRADNPLVMASLHWSLKLVQVLYVLLLTLVMKVSLELMSVSIQVVFIVLLLIQRVPRVHSL